MLKKLDEVYQTIIDIKTIKLLTKTIDLLHTNHVKLVKPCYDFKQKVLYKIASTHVNNKIIQKIHIIHILLKISLTHIIYRKGITCKYDITSRWYLLILFTTNRII